MIKNLLNNPWIVSAMGLIAVAVLTFNVVLPVFGRSNTEPFDAAPTDAPGDEPGMEERGTPIALVKKQVGETRVERGAVYWSDSPRRDPYALHKPAVVTMSVPAVTQQRVEVVEIAVGKEIVLPDFGGLVFGNNIRLAMLDRQVLGIGDAINDYTVIKIDADSVLIRGRDGQTYDVFSEQ